MKARASGYRTLRGEQSNGRIVDWILVRRQGIGSGSYPFLCFAFLSLIMNAKTLTPLFPFCDYSSSDTAALIHLASHSCVSVRDSTTIGVPPGCSSFELVEQVNGSLLGTAKTTCIFRAMLEQDGQGREMVIVVAVKANDGKLDWVVDLNCGMAEIVDSEIVVCVIQVFILPFLEGCEYSRQHGIGAHK
jgi:hypothetical protein